MLEQHFIAITTPGGASLNKPVKTTGSPPRGRGPQMR